MAVPRDDPSYAETKRYASSWIEVNDVASSVKARDFTAERGCWSC